MDQFTFPLDVESTGFAMAAGEQPQKRLEHYGTGAASDTELLAMVLQGSGTPAEASVRIASRLLADAGSIDELLFWTANDYQKMKGIGRAKGLQLAAIAEIARRMMAPQRMGQPLLNRPELVAAHLAPTVAGLQVEKFFVLCLNRKNRLIKQVEIASGTATAVLVGVKEVFRAVLSIPGGVTCAVALAHNHPSGSPEPSAADIEVTKRILTASKTLDIEFLDHLILGRIAHDASEKGYFSFKEAGMLRT